MDKNEHSHHAATRNQTYSRTDKRVQGRTGIKQTDTDIKKREKKKIGVQKHEKEGKES